MRSALLFAAVVVALAAGAACGSSDENGEGDASPDPNGVPQQGSAGTGLATGLPCDVQALLENRCIACHNGSAPESPRLLEYADLVAPSKSDPTKTMAQAALTRMRTPASPMPPPPAVPPNVDELETFETWVILGAQKSAAACTDTPPVRADSGAPPFDPASVKCTSGTTWTGGTQGSPLMRPGAACNACHQVMGGPNLAIAGTVYPTANEPDDCNGSVPAPELTVTVTDAKGRVLTIPANAAGNFSIARAGKLTPPFRASVTDGTKTRAMKGTVTSGDCNSCHTVAGANGAPGRIMAP